MQEKINKHDILIQLMSLQFKTVQIHQLEKILPWFMKNKKAQFTNHNVYSILYDGEAVDLKRKGYYPKYRNVQYLMEHFRNIELLDCEDVEARGKGIRIYCTLNENHKYWIATEENRKIFIKLHELRNLVTRGRNHKLMNKEKGFKRQVSLYFSENL